MESNGHCCGASMTINTNETTSARSCVVVGLENKKLRSYQSEQLKEQVAVYFDK